MLRVTIVAGRNSGLSTRNSRQLGSLRIAFKLFVSSRNSYTECFVDFMSLVTFGSRGQSYFFAIKEKERKKERGLAFLQISNHKRFVVKQTNAPS